MRIARLIELFKHRINRKKPRRSLIKTFWNFSFVTPKISGALLGAFDLVNSPYKLAPTHDLTHQSLC